MKKIFQEFFHIRIYRTHYSVGFDNPRCFKGNWLFHKWNWIHYETMQAKGGIRIFGFSIYYCEDL